MRKDRLHFYYNNSNELILKYLYFLPSPSVLSDPGKMLRSRTRSSLGARSEIRLKRRRKEQCNLEFISLRPLNNLWINLIVTIFLRANISHNLKINHVSTRISRKKKNVHFLLKNKLRNFNASWMLFTLLGISKIKQHTIFFFCERCKQNSLGIYTIYIKWDNLLSTLFQPYHQERTTRWWFKQKQSSVYGIAVRVLIHACTVTASELLLWTSICRLSWRHVHDNNDADFVCFFFISFLIFTQQVYLTAFQSIIYLLSWEKHYELCQ